MKSRANMGWICVPNPQEIKSHTPRFHFFFLGLLFFFFIIRGVTIDIKIKANIYHKTL